jgi:hypothetical protein
MDLHRASRTPRRARGDAPPRTACRLTRPLFVFGTSALGPFRGRAVAVAVEDPLGAAEQTRYLVEDPERDEPLWVEARDIDQSAPVAPGEPVIGYVTVRGDYRPHASRAPVAAIRRACDETGWQLIDIAIDREHGAPLERPGLTRALREIARGAARGLVIPDFDRVAAGDGERRALMTSVHRAGGEVVALEDSTTDQRPAGRRAALAERAALAQRITELRAAGMAPQAIAALLNKEGIEPVVGFDSVWHSWSVREVGGAWPPRGPGRRGRRGRPPTGG